MYYQYNTANTKDVSALIFDVEESNDVATGYFKRMYPDLKCAFIVPNDTLDDITDNLCIPCVVKGIFTDQAAPFNKTQTIGTSILSMMLEYNEDGDCEPAVMYKNVSWSKSEDDMLFIVMTERCFNHFVETQD